MTPIPESDPPSLPQPASSTPATPDTNPPSSKSAIILLQPNGLANPSRTVFDPWNSSGTGHQRSENRLASSTSWRSNRNLKLSAQYRGGLGGGERVSDTGQKSIWESFRGRRHPERRALKEQDCLDSRKHQGDNTQEQEQRQEEDREQNAEVDKAIFRNLCIYVNGSTAPLISDHKLKHLLAKHGATLSIALGRRSVTHVILGNAVNNGGAGGGLAGSKIQKEITRVRGKGIKFVTAEWAVESIKAGRRLNEAQFSNTRFVAPSGQNSVLGMFKSVKRGQS